MEPTKPHSIASSQTPRGSLWEQSSRVTFSFGGRKMLPQTCPKSQTEKVDASITATSYNFSKNYFAPGRNFKSVANAAKEWIPFPSPSGAKAQSRITVILMKTSSPAFSRELLIAPIPLLLLLESENWEFISLQPFRRDNRHAFHFPANPTLPQQGKACQPSSPLFVLLPPPHQPKKKHNSSKQKEGCKNEFALELIAFQKSFISYMFIQLCNIGSTRGLKLDVYKDTSWPLPASFWLLQPTGITQNSIYKPAYIN